jgi:hypothetical protein
MSWFNVRRLFHFDGDLAGFHYRARLGIFELNTLAGFSEVNDIRDTGHKQLPGTTDSPIAFELQVWESEGGAE